MRIIQQGLGMILGCVILLSSFHATAFNNSKPNTKYKGDEYRSTPTVRIKSMTIYDNRTIFTLTKPFSMMYCVDVEYIVVNHGKSEKVKQTRALIRNTLALTVGVDNISVQVYGMCMGAFSRHFEAISAALIHLDKWH